MDHVTEDWSNDITFKKNILKQLYVTIFIFLLFSNECSLRD